MSKVGMVALPGANISSVSYWLQRNGVGPQNLSLVTEFDGIDVLVLPGVGTFQEAVGFIDGNNLRNSLLDFVESGRTLVGICLGMQLLFESSEEGDGNGLGLLKGKVQKIPSGETCVPNVGWRKVYDDRGFDEKYFFMHSYAVHQTYSAGLELARTVNCNGKWLAAFKRENVIGFQFHPEKSYTAGDRCFEELVASAL